MTKAPTLTTIASGYASNTQLNNNFDAIEVAFENTLSLDGSTPNAMNADLDMDSNDILNAGSIYSSRFYVNGQNVNFNTTVVVGNVAVKKEFETVTILLADTRTYTDYSVGDYIRVVSGGFVYKVAASGATDQHVTTAGGVKLYVQLGADGCINARSTGAALDGIADDTLPMIAAFKAARAVQCDLVLDGHALFLAATVPAGDRVAGSGGDYVSTPRIVGVGSAEFSVVGNIGFSQPGLKNRGLKDLTVNISGNELTESSLRTSRTLFMYTTNSCEIADYSGLVFNVAVTNVATGQWRHRGFIQDNTADVLRFENITGENVSLALLGYYSPNVFVSDIYMKNVETSVYLTNCTSFTATNFRHINTKAQADAWVQRTNAVPVIYNGMNAFLVENGQNGIISNIRSEWAIERCLYIQSSNVSISDCYALNSDGFKAIGDSYTSYNQNISLSNCHVLLDDDWAATLGRVNIAHSIFYWVNNVVVDGGSYVNTDPSRITSTAACFVGLTDGSTVENYSVSGLTVVNVNRLVLGFLSILTTAQLAALFPAGSFISLRDLRISKCTIQRSDRRELGALLEMRSVGASADALAAIGAENITLTDNTIVEPNTAANRADFIFYPRWLNNVVSIGTTVNLPFQANGFFFSAVPAPYSNITLDERALKFSNDAGILHDRLANLSVLNGSRVGFDIGYGTSIAGRLDAVLYTTGAINTGQIKVALTGKGYATVATTLADWAVNMQSGGNYYWGRFISGTLTNQISTPPVSITNAGAIINIRGDLVPTVLWGVELQKTT